MPIFNRVKGAVFGAILFPCLPLIAGCIGAYNAFAPDRYKAPETGFCEGLMVLGAAVPAVVMAIAAVAAFPVYGVMALPLAVGIASVLGAVAGFVLEGK